jgi:hypothetical protein
MMGGFDPLIDAFGIVISIGDIDFVEPAIIARQFKLLVQSPNEA